MIDPMRIVMLNECIRGIEGGTISRYKGEVPR